MKSNADRLQPCLMPEVIFISVTSLFLMKIEVWSLEYILVIIFINLRCILNSRSTFNSLKRSMESNALEKSIGSR